MKQYTVYLEDDLDVKVSEYKKVKRNNNTSQVIREILYDFFDNIADKSANLRPTLTPEERAEIDENWDR